MTTITTTMEDSGLSESMLRLSSPTLEVQPAVQMPSSSTKNQLQDSGICSDLLQRLSLEGSADGSSSTPINPSAFFEPDEDGDVQLHLAVAEGLADVVDALVRMAPNAELLSLQNNQGYSPLHIAVLQNQPLFVRRLVTTGAKVALSDAEGNTPLHLAARRGYVECAEALLRPVLPGEVQSPPHSPTMSPPLMQQPNAEIFNIPNNLGQYCVHLATMGGHVAFLQFLKWNRADMNALEGRGGRSSLHLAVGARSLPLVQCLVEPSPQGCGVDPTLLDWYGRTPYQLSLMNGQSEIASYLYSRTPNANSSSWPEAVASDSEEEFCSAPPLVNSSA